MLFLSAMNVMLVKVGNIKRQGPRAGGSLWFCCAFGFDEDMRPFLGQTGPRRCFVGTVVGLRGTAGSRAALVVSGSQLSFPCMLGLLSYLGGYHGHHSGLVSL